MAEEDSLENFFKDDETIIDLDEEAMESDDDGMSGNTEADDNSMAEDSILETSLDIQNEEQSSSMLSTDSNNLNLHLDTSVSENLSTSVDNSQNHSENKSTTEFSSQTSSENSQSLPYTSSKEDSFENIPEPMIDEALSNSHSESFSKTSSGILDAGSLRLKSGENSVVSSDQTDYSRKDNMGIYNQNSKSELDSAENNSVLISEETPNTSMNSKSSDQTIATKTTDVSDTSSQNETSQNIFTEFPDIEQGMQCEKNAPELTLSKNLSQGSLSEENLPESTLSKNLTQSVAEDISNSTEQEEQRCGPEAPTSSRLPEHQSTELKGKINTSSTNDSKEKLPFSGIKDLFTTYFPSTDSDSDCDRLVLDYKTQSDSESCSEIKKTDEKDKRDNGKSDSTNHVHEINSNLMVGTKEDEVKNLNCNDDVVLEADTSSISQKKGKKTDVSKTDSGNGSLEVNQRINESEVDMEAETMETELDNFGPGLSLSAVTHISPEEFERMGKEETNLQMASQDGDDIDPSEIQSVPVGNLGSVSHVEEIGVPEKNEKQVPFPVKIKSEPLDDEYEAAMAPRETMSNDTLMTNGNPETEQLVEGSGNPIKMTNTTSSGPVLNSDSKLNKTSPQNNLAQTISKSSPLISTIPYGNSKGKVLILSNKSGVNKGAKRKQIIHPRTLAPSSDPSLKPVHKPITGRQVLQPKLTSLLPKVKTDSFSVVCVTKMMQRKHKIGGHKAQPIPPEFKNCLLNYYPSACLECGDSFISKDTIDMHMERVSILIEYDCPLCKTKCTFYNKCAFLSHIRQHNKDQAASKNPAIQVKADILTIKMAPKEKILESLERTFEPFKTIPIPEEQIKCAECDKFFSDKIKLKNHFGSNELICSFNFVCYTCNMVLPKKCAFEAHKRYHSIKPPFVCPECGEVFPLFPDFRYHIKNVCLHFSRSSFLQCDSIANLKCTYKDILLTPMTKHLQNQHLFARSTFTSQDGKTTNLNSNVTRYLNHVDQLNLKKVSASFYCNICQERNRRSTYITGPVSFTDLRLAQDHMFHHLTEIKRNATFCFICTFCPEKNRAIFKKKSLLRDHIVSKHPQYTKKPTAYDCCICNSTLESYSKLLAHQLRVHEYINSEFYFCNACKVMFENPVLMEKHICKQNVNNRPANPVIGGVKVADASPFLKRASPTKVSPVDVNVKRLKQLRPKPTPPPPPPPEKHTCEICQLEFESKEKFENHNQSEHSSFPCHLCGLTYDSKQKVTRHFEMTHQSDKPGYFCLVCKKKGYQRHFNSPIFLEKHLIFKHRISKSRVQRFVSIGKESRSKEATKRLYTAESEHEPETQPVKRLRKEGSGSYACVKCTFSTENSEEFSKHIETHKTVDANQCPECGMCFSALPSLKKHLFLVHKIRNSEEYLKSKGINEPEELPPDSDEESIDVVSPRKKSLDNIVPIETVRKKDGPVGELECRVCYKEFDSLNLLKNHMRVHGMAFIRSRRAPASPQKNDFKESP